MLRLALIFFGVGFFVFGAGISKASAATYYVRADGTVTCANKANATSPNSVGTALSMAQVNACTFLAGESVLFSSQGGNYTTTLILPSGGSGVGTEITYGKVLNETPAITGTFSPMINTNSKSNVKVVGFSVTYSGTDVSANGIAITGNSSSNITISSSTVNMGGYGYAVSSGANTLSNVNINSNTLLGGRTGNPSLYFYGTSLSNFSITNHTVTESGWGTRLKNINGLTINGFNMSGSPSATGLSIESGSGVISVSNLTITTTTAPGLTIINSSGVTVSNSSYTGKGYGYYVQSNSSNISLINDTSDGLTVGGGFYEVDSSNVSYTDCTAINGGSYAQFSATTNTGVSSNISYLRCHAGSQSMPNYSNGFVTKGSVSGVTYTNCTADYNSALGFAALESSSNVTYKYCSSSYNGTVNITSDGGGFLPHNTATNVNVYYSITHHNYNEGFGDVSSGVNTVYNSINWANGYGVGDIFKGSTVTTPANRGNMYFSNINSGDLFKNIISGGSSKPRERRYIGSIYPMFDFNLYKPADDSKFVSYDGTNEISWATYHATNETHSQNADPLLLNTSGNYNTDTDFQLSYLSPGIDAGTIIAGIATDYIGNPIYGNPDIGVYEYQPPHTVGIDKIDIAAGARIYGDGKFRDLTATSSNMADLKIAPASGSFPTFNATDTRPEWLNISNITWTNTGNHHKAWTESSATLGAAITLHTIGDLQANKLYNVSVDSSLGQNISGANGTTCTNGICQANAQGKISFLYTGGYSTHTFDVIEGDNNAPTTTANVNTGLYNSTQNITLSCDDGSGVGCDKTYYTIDGNDPTTGSTQYSSPISIAVTTTLKFFSTDKFGNTESIKTKTYTIDTTPPDTVITTQPDSVINSSNANFNFEADETSTFQCKLDSEAYATCTSPKSYTGLAEGSHTFFVKATDTATNEDSTPAEYTFAVDTQIPTLSDLSPNGTMFPVSTTSVNLTMSTSENAICRYATTSGTAYGAMTIFDTTNSTSHSTLVTGLNPGTTYDYYVRCKDAVNESAESHLSFSVAPLEATTTIEKIKIQVNRETNKFKDTINIASTKFKLKSQDQNLANGNVEIYKGGKLWKTVSADASGAWSSTLKFGKDTSQKIKVMFYDVFGTLIGDQSATVKVDSEDPKFTAFITPYYSIRKGDILYWEAKDNVKADHFKVTFNGKVKTVKNARFTVPQDTPNGTYEITVKVYDAVGNSATKKTWVRVR